MAALPVESVADLVRLLATYRLLEPARQDEVARDLQARFTEPRDLARELLRRDWITAYQVNQLFLGHARDLQLGHYLLLERLGRGGMGQVFKAHDRDRDRVVAIKLVRRDREVRPELVRRFRREIRVAARLSHRHIVSAYGAGQVRGILFLVMEYVRGTTLSRLVKRRGPLPVNVACDFIRQAALGLQHAHECGLVHRDIKPGNLLLSEQGVVKVLDLGLARLDEPAPTTGRRLTRVGAVVGSADFLAPEQVVDARRVDGRADLYSLGCTLYALLAARVPFAGGSQTDKLIRHREDEPPPLANVPSAVSEVVGKLMAKRPDDRYPTAADLADVLAKLIPDLGGPALVSPEAASQKLPDWMADWIESLAPDTPAGSAQELPEWIGSLAPDTSFGSAMARETMKGQPPHSGTSPDQRRDG